MNLALANGDSAERATCMVKASYFTLRISMIDHNCLLISRVHVRTVIFGPVPPNGGNSHIQYIGNTQTNLGFLALTNVSTV